MAATPLRLLYVDDDPGLRRLVQRGLNAQGLQVEVAADGLAGLERLALGGIDVIALDQMMPGLDGMETLARIQQLADPPPVVFVTGTEEGRLAVAALKAGAADYVIKDVAGEFITLLRVAAEGALAAAQMRRGRAAAEAEVREARDRFEALAIEREMLLREVNHRVGNSLQLIAALLQLQAAASSATPDVKLALANATSRVMAVAQVHRRLYTSNDVQSVAIDQYLEALISDLRRSADEPQRPLLTFESQPVEIDPDRAVAIGVIVNELVINALKYAYPSGRGPIRIALSNPQPNRALLCVEDDGVGTLQQTTLVSTGLGRQIVSAMASKLGATVSRDDAHAGTRVLVAFELGQNAAPEPAAAR